MIAMPRLVGSFGHGSELTCLSPFWGGGGTPADLRMYATRFVLSVFLFFDVRQGVSNGSRRPPALRFAGSRLVRGKRPAGRGFERDTLALAQRQPAPEAQDEDKKPSDWGEAAVVKTVLGSHVGR